MSVCDDMREVMECARMEDECDYSVYSQMFDLIGDVEAENEKLREYVIALETCKHAASYCDFCPDFQQDFDDEAPHCAFDFEGLRAAAGIEV